MQKRLTARVVERVPVCNMCRLSVMLTNFRIGGAVWGERVQYEPLTDVVNLLPMWQREPVSLQLARQMQALCICAKELLDEYSIQPQDVNTQRSLLYANGIPSMLHDTTRCVDFAHDCIYFS